MLISIILPVYNGEKFIVEAINSCLNQTHQNIELIIVNDCSTDGTAQIIEDFKDKDSRVKIIHNIENKKLPSSLNIGHAIAKGTLITWTSHDNFYEKNALKELQIPIKEGIADISFSNYHLIDADNNIKSQKKLPVIESLIFGNCIGACFLYTREVYERNSGYNEKFFLVEDYDFWLRAFFHSKFIHVDKFLYKYRIHENSLTNDISKDHVKNGLWKENCKKMFSEIFSKLLENSDRIATIFSSKLTYDYIDFNLLIQENPTIILLKEKLKNNPNMKKYRCINSLFLKMSIEIMINNQDKNKNIRKCYFILKNYFYCMDKNSFKTLIKYSFFK